MEISRVSDQWKDIQINHLRLTNRRFFGEGSLWRTGAVSLFLTDTNASTVRESDINLRMSI
jgi:hypothetical protein